MKKLMKMALAALAVVAAGMSASAQITTDTLLARQKAHGHNALWGQRASLFNKLGVDSTDIVMLGNSITHYNEWAELLDNPKVRNRGISGDVVQGIQDRLESVVEGHPAKIFLMIGVNDVSHDLTADSIVEAQLALIDRIMRETPKTKLYVQSVLPINNSFGRYKKLKGKEQVVRDINIKLRPEVEKRGLQWIELYSAMTDEEGNLRKDLTNDGLHLLPEAYEIWIEILRPYINE